MRPDDAWRAEFALQCWLLGLDGTVGVRGRTADVRANFLDIVDQSDSLVGISGRVEIGHGRLAAYLDGMYDRVTSEGATGPRGVADIDVTFEESLLDFGVMYRIAQAGHGAARASDHVATRVGAGSPAVLQGGLDADFDADLYLGGRFMSVDLELDPATRPPRSGGRSWTDPLVGARLRFPLGDGFRLSVNGDVGGFGVASEFTWSATALVGYDFPLFGARASLELGYRAIGSDYTEGHGANRFTWDVVQHGPLLGLSLRF